MSLPNARRRTLFERVYLVGVAIKGFDGLVELLLGVVLLFAPSLVHLALKATASEAAEGTNPLRLWLADYITRTDRALVASSTIGLIVFLIVHGVVKVATAYCLVRRIHRAYPWAIAALALLLAFQLYTVVLDSTVTGWLVTALDVAILLLVVREYRLLRAEASVRSLAGTEKPS